MYSSESSRQSLMFTPFSFSKTCQEQLMCCASASLLDTGPRDTCVLRRGRSMGRPAGRPAELPAAPPRGHIPDASVHVSCTLRLCRTDGVSFLVRAPLVRAPRSRISGPVLAEGACPVPRGGSARHRSLQISKGATLREKVTCDSRTYNRTYSRFLFRGLPST
jgi:hypothetical protein